MRGGYRPGSGPRKGAKYKKRSLKNIPESDLTPEQEKNVRRMLSFAKRTMNGEELTDAEVKELEGFKF